LSLSPTTTNPTFSIQRQVPRDPGSTVCEDIGPDDASQAVYEEPMLAKCRASLPNASNASDMYNVPTNIKSTAVELDDNAYVAEMVPYNDFSATKKAADQPTEEHVVSVGGTASSDAREAHLDKSSNMNDAVIRQRGSFSLMKPLRRSEFREVIDDTDENQTDV
jgi:hypothetical protein